MAAVIGDFVSDPSSHFHNMIAAGSALSHQHSRDSSYRSTSRSGDSAAPRRPLASPRYQQQRSQDWAASEPPEKRTAGSGASRFPTPPSSSSPNHAAAAHVCSHNAKGDDDLMASQAPDAARTGSTTVDGPSTSAVQQQQPSPASDTTADTAYHLADASSPRVRPQGQTIHIRDLAHIQNLARADVLKGEGSGILNESSSPQIKYEISGMPIGDVIEMVAALLTKITTTNDLQHDAMQRNVAHQQQASQNSESGNGPQMSPLSTSVLAFHGKNIPAITILSYLSRIHKYCPTTYEVFLSLLVYFDRMTERVNDLIVKTEGRRQTSSDGPKAPSGPPAPANDVEMHDEESDEADETDSDLADDDDDDDEDMVDSAPRNGAGQAPRNGGSVIPGSDPVPSVSPAAYFVVDSFNIHRLIIAGVTCASKFFSDVFYTNSRYAKVGGLPLAELNHLELQFLLLNDFRLAVPVEDLEAYGTMLVEFYAREVVRPQARSAPADA